MVQRVLKYFSWVGQGPTLRERINSGLYKNIVDACSLVLKMTQDK